MHRFWTCSQLPSTHLWTNEWKRLLAENKNMKMHTNNKIKQCIYQRCYQVTKHIYGNPTFTRTTLLLEVMLIGTTLQQSTIIWNWKIRLFSFFTFSTLKWVKLGVHFGVIRKPTPDFLIPVHWSYFDISSSFLTNHSSLTVERCFRIESIQRRSFKLIYGSTSHYENICHDYSHMSHSLDIVDSFTCMPWLYNQSVLCMVCNRTVQLRLPSWTKIIGILGSNYRQSTHNALEVCD